MELEICTSIATVLSVVIVLISLKSVIALMPRLIASFYRSRICLEMEFSRSNQVVRDRISAAVLLPFSMIVWHFELYRPDFWSYLGPSLSLVADIALILLFRFLRLGIAKMLHPKIKSEVYEAVCNFELSAFILGGIIMMIEAFILTLCNLPVEVARKALLWTLAAIYLLFIIRRTQIFASDCPLYSAILYLCALEVIPTGLLVASALLL